LFRPENPAARFLFPSEPAGGANNGWRAAERFAALAVINAIPGALKATPPGIIGRLNLCPSPSAPFGYFAGKTSK
jgi:hypothetical protein